MQSPSRRWPDHRMPDVELTDDDERFRHDVAKWLAEHVVGEYAELQGSRRSRRRRRRLRRRVALGARARARPGFIGLGWPVEAGGRGATPRPADHLGRGVRTAPRRPRASTTWARTCSRPRSSSYGTPEQQERFLPGDPARRRALVPGLQRAQRGLRPRQRADARACATVTSGWSTARRSGRRSRTCRTGASSSARTDPAVHAPPGLSFLLVPMEQPGVEVRPIVQPTGGGEFNEVFFDDAAHRGDLVVGEVGEGWRIAMGLLGFERGVSTLAQQVGFERELDHVLDLARERDRPAIRPRAAHAARRRVDRAAAHEAGTRCAAWRPSGVPGPEASISKLFWGTWHRDLGNLDDRRARRRRPDRSVRRGRCRTTSRSSRSCSCSAAPTRSTAVRTRSSATSWESASSDCRGEPA